MKKNYFKYNCEGKTYYGIPSEPSLNEKDSLYLPIINSLSIFKTSDSLINAPNYVGLFCDCCKNFVYAKIKNSVVTCQCCGKKLKGSFLNKKTLKYIIGLPYVEDGKAIYPFFCSTLQYSHQFISDSLPLLKKPMMLYNFANLIIGENAVIQTNVPNNLSENDLNNDCLNLKEFRFDLNDIFLDFIIENKNYIGLSDCAIDILKSGKIRSIHYYNKIEPLIDNYFELYKKGYRDLFYSLIFETPGIVDIAEGNILENLNKMSDTFKDLFKSANRGISSINLLQLYNSICSLYKCCPISEEDASDLVLNTNFIKKHRLISQYLIKLFSINKITFRVCYNNYLKEKSIDESCSFEDFLYDALYNPSGWSRCI